MNVSYLYTWSVYLHNILRWVIVILLVIGIIRHLTAWLGKKYYTGADVKRDTYLMGSAHFMLLLGIFQWAFGPWGLKNIQNSGMGAVMKDAVSRFWAVEHFVTMLIAIVFITLGKGVAKKGITDAAKHKKAFIFFAIAALLIVLAMPWPWRDGVARALYPSI